MCKIYKYYLSLTSITLLLTIASCSSRYQMTDSYKYESGRKQMIKLDNVWMKLYLYPNDKNEQEFNVICTFDEIAKGKPLKLSGLKITFSDAKTGDTATISKPVELNSMMHQDTTKHIQYISNSDLQTSKVVDLNEHMFYTFFYLFKVNNSKQPVTKIQIHIEASLYSNGKMEAINKTYPFEKKSYWNIPGD